MKKQKGEGRKKTGSPASLYEYGFKDENWPQVRYCPECGKEFCVPMMEAYVYKDMGVAVCSWGCLRAREKRRAEDPIRKKDTSKNARMSPEQRAMVQQLAMQGVSAAEISERAGVSIQAAWYYHRMIRKAKGEGGNEGHDAG